MTAEISRREFLRVWMVKSRKPLHMLVRLLAVIVAAWLAYIALQALMCITLHGWMLLGFLLVLAALFSTIRFLAVRMYSLLSIRGKAFCHAAGELIHVAILVGIGILAWHQYWIAGKPDEGVFITVILVWAIAARARKVYLDSLKTEN